MKTNPMNSIVYKPWGYYQIIDQGKGYLVKNITGKIQDKISSGHLDESQLFSEAQNVMKNFSKGGSKGPGGMGNPMEINSVTDLLGYRKEGPKSPCNTLDR